MALCDVDWAFFMLTLGALLLARYDTGRAGAWDAFLLGFALYAAYFCCPTSALLIVVALGYLWSTWRKEALNVALTAFALLLPLVAFSWLEFGTLLPAYYLELPMRWLTGRQLIPRLREVAALILVFPYAYVWSTRPKHRVLLAFVGCALLPVVLAILMVGLGSLSRIRCWESKGQTDEAFGSDRPLTASCSARTHSIRSRFVSPRCTG